MKKQAQRRVGFQCSLTIIVSIIVAATAIAGASGSPIVIPDKDTLTAVESLYGLTKNAAISRLAKEGKAARQDRVIRSMNLKSYAGSWFDGKTMRLFVAISNSTDSAAVRSAGAAPVIVRYSVAALEKARKTAVAVLKNAPLAEIAIRDSYIDVKSNQVVIGVASDDRVATARFLDSVGINSRLVRVAPSADAEFSTGYVRGADGTLNSTWAQDFGGVHPCSIGAPVAGGYATAGHCGSAGDAITSADGSPLGTVDQSSFSISTYTFANYEDGAWVATNPNWLPVAQINGYSDGTLQVDGEWSGTLKAPIGATVCRYGQTSGGPHCGTVAELNVTKTFSSSTIEGLTQVDGVCTADGDSGGTIITPSGQVQGTNTGGNTGGSGNSCPDDSSDIEYFQPIQATLDRFNLTMLTAHGSNPPSVNGFICPNSGDSGSGGYACTFESYNSQGVTSMSWTTNTTGDMTTSGELFGHCYPHQTVQVTLAATNSYGTSHKSASFTCPNYPRH